MYPKTRRRDDDTRPDRDRRRQETPVRDGIPATISLRKAAIHEALRIIKRKDDLGTPQDGEGFSLPHLKAGRALAVKDDLTPEEIPLGCWYVYRFRRQIPLPLLAAVFGDRSLADIKQELSPRRSRAPATRARRTQREPARRGQVGARAQSTRTRE